MTEEKDIGITVKKEENFSEWYNQVVRYAELADFSDIKGFMVIKPNGYGLWENIQKYFDAKIKKTGHKNTYFPTLIPERFLTKEADHVQGFAPEVMWVTHMGEEKLEERLAMRPTSETIMYDTYSRLIRSWRDLPLLWNQWCSVYRADTKMTKLFLRTREFLWQEGHTVHATKEDADEEVMMILEFYKELMETQLAIPVLTGKKTDAERFPGALYTTTLEALMPDGKALQMGTSHNLGQGFAKAFGIKFEDEKGEEKYVWQTSWGISTRLIGALVMVHGDDKGLVLPPRIAHTKLVIVPIIFEKTKEKVLKKASELKEKLFDYGVELDARENYSAGWKFNEWEMRGVPLRLEIGPKDLENGQVVLVRRDNGKKEVVKEKDLKKKIDELLEKMQSDLFNKAKKFLDNNLVEAKNWKEFDNAVKDRKMVLASFCETGECEGKIKEETTAISRCIPFEQKEKEEKCVKCGKKALRKAYFSKAY